MHADLLLSGEEVIERKENARKPGNEQSPPREKDWYKNSAHPRLGRGQPKP